MPQANNPPNTAETRAAEREIRRGIVGIRNITNAISNAPTILAAMQWIIAAMMFLLLYSKAISSTARPGKPYDIIEKTP